MKTKKEWLSIKRVLVFIAWFFLLTCCKADSYSSPQSTFTSKKAAAGSYNRLGINEKQHKKGYGSKLMMKPNKESDDHNPIYKRPSSSTSRACKTLQEFVHLGDGHIHDVERAGNDHQLISQLKKANKAVYGGGDLLHPRKKGAASSVVMRSTSSFLSIAFRGVTIVLLFFGFF